MFSSKNIDLGIDVNTCPIRTSIYLICDYCGKEFVRDKKSTLKLRKNIEKDSCGDKPCTKVKKVEISRKLFGSDNIFSSKEFKEKHLSCFGTKEFTEKRKKTLIEKYGVDSPLKNQAIRSRQQQTCKERYSEDHNTQKSIETSLSKYGVEYPMQLQKFTQKRDETNQKKYGVKSFTQTPEYKVKNKETCLEKYGVNHSSKHPPTREKAKQTNLKRYGVSNYSKTQEAKERAKQHFLETIGVPNPLCLDKNRQYGKTQNEIAEWLASLGFDFKSDYNILDGKEIDLYNDNLKLAIEYCGLFWHNELSPEPRDKHYHYNKYEACRQRGVRLITIFEDEWKGRQEQCKNFIMSCCGIFQHKVFARKCDVVEISKKDSYEFCSNYHIQGASKHVLVAFGLILNGELIGVMSLGRHPRKSEVLVLDRLCFKTGWQVAGGASRLIAACSNYAKQNNCNIITWSDNRWSAGNVYEKMGFVLDEELPPDYSYVDAKHPYTRISKQSQMKSITGCPKNITEHQWALDHGLARIWDCGKKRWMLTL